MTTHRLLLTMALAFSTAVVGCSDETGQAGGTGGGAGGGMPGTGGGAGQGGTAGTGGGAGQGGTAGTGDSAAIDCDPCSGQPVEQNNCDNSGTTFLVFASCIMAATPGPTLTMQFAITPTPADCPIGGDGTKDLVVANQCDLVVRHLDGTEVTVDWAPFLGGLGGECFQSTDCPGHGVERYGANWRDVPELSAPPFNGMNGTCEDVVRVAVDCSGTAYDCDYTTPSRELCE